MRFLVRLAALLAIPAGALAQGLVPPPALATRPGWELGGEVSHYRYEEPDFAKLTGERFGAEAAYTLAAPYRPFWRFEGRVSYGSLRYEGSGTQSGVPDWLTEVRALVGKDFGGQSRFAFSPYVGFGVRYLYNDLRGESSTGAVGYRRYSTYLYLPLGATLRFAGPSGTIIAPSAEYDYLIKGRQISKLSDTGLGLSDLTNTQNSGHGWRFALMVETSQWSFGPWAASWDIGQSDLQPIGGGFVGFEPANRTREYGLAVRRRY